MFHHADRMNGDARTSRHSGKTFYYNVEVLCFDHSLYNSEPLVVRRIKTDCDQNKNRCDEYR